MFDMVHKFYPGRRFETVHVTSEVEILHASKHGSETTSSAAGGHEPDRERHGISFLLLAGLTGACSALTTTPR